MGIILNGLRKLLILALSILPDSPFRGFLDDLAELPFLGYLNWFIPISDFLKLLTVWCAAVAIFYLASVMLRFAKAIQ
ncbi:MAG: hypothetical protein HFG72_11530 [Hungatella sp.]|jgi:hypothetical protein|nr:hypothetical protein [Hungatella sp.]